MSVEGAPVPQPEPGKAKPRKRLKVEPLEGGQLEQFLIMNAAAAEAAAAVGEDADKYKADVKNWLLALFPNPDALPDAFDIAADPHGRYPAYTMTLKGGWHLDTEAMTRDGHGELIERYKTPNRTSWELRASQQGQGQGRKYR